MAKNLSSVKWYLRLSAAVACLLVLLPAASALAVSISKGYSTTDTSLKINMIASQTKNSSDGNELVERANNGNKGKVVGIVTTIDSSLITLSNSNAQVYVTTSGDADVYVSDLNGDIKQGDYIVVSPLTGIGMKAADSDTQVVGAALEDFNKDKAITQKVSTKEGSERTVLINKVKINVDPHDRSLDAAEQKPYLVLFGQSITGKTVTQAQVIVALVIFFLLLIVEGSIIYGAIHSSIISVGRNPLARTALFKQLFQVSWLAFIVLLFGLGSIYIILWI